MSTFVGKATSPYRKANPPLDEASRFLYMDKQLQEIQKSTALLVEATKQLQDEMTLIWSALNALGQTRP